MDDYLANLVALNPDAPGTDIEGSSSSVITEYNGVPDTTGNERIPDEVKEFDTVYLAPKKVLVKRYKLKKL